jgi:hypothetical protein
MRITRIFSLFVTLTILAWSSLAHSSCVTTVYTGQCPASGAYAQSSNFTESNGYNTYVDNDVSGGYGVTPATQTLTATSGSSWYVSADFGASTHQMSFPMTLQNYNAETVDSFTNIVVTANDTIPSNSGTGVEAGLLIYLNSWGNSFEIQHYVENESTCNGTTPVKTSIQFGGSYGVPTNSWDLCYTGSMYYWQIVGSGSSWGFSSGSVDLAAMLMYLENNGYLSSGTTISRVRYGFMIYTTSSTQETFSLNSYTLLNNVAGSPTISLSPTSLSFSATQGGGNPSAQNVTVSNSGSGTLAAPTNSIVFHQGSGWLSVNCTGSSAPYTCSNQVVTGSLAAGTYNATVSIASSGATNTPQAYTVAFTVNPVSSPAISLSPTNLTFNATVGGGNPSSQNVSVSNSGGGTLASPTTAIVYHSGSGWLSVQTQGSQAPYTLVTQPTTGSLAAGTYTATVNVSSSGASNSPQPYTVTFTVSSGSVCTQTSTNGTCPVSGAYDVPQEITESNGYNTYVTQDVWDPPSGSWSQTLYSTNPGDWYVLVNFPTDNTGAIHSYPDTNQLYNSETVGSFSALYSSFSESAPSSSPTVGDYGYDIWSNNGLEVMIQHQVAGEGPCQNYMTLLGSNLSFGGTNGVPVMTWNLCKNGSSNTSELVYQPTNSGGSYFGFSSGSVDIKAMLEYLISNGIEWSSSTGLGAIDYGFEISTTGGTSKTFAVNSFTLTNN